MQQVKESAAERAARIEFSENGRKLRQRIVLDKKKRKEAKRTTAQWLVMNNHD